MEIKEKVEMINRGEIPKGYKKTKVGIIPEDWEVEKIKNISNINKSQLSNNTEKDYEFYYFDLSSVSEGQITMPGEKIRFQDSPSRARRIFNKNDILMSTVRPYLKGFGYVDFEMEDCVCSTGFAVITSNKECDSLYIYHNIFSVNINNQIEKLLVGSNYPAINNTDVERLKIPYSKCDIERVKISQVLSTWDEAIELKEKLIEQKKQQKKGLMQNLLTGKLRLSGFDGEWEEKAIGELITESRIVAKKSDINKRITVKLNLKGIEKRDISSNEKEGATTHYIREEGQFIYGKQNLHKGALGLIPEYLDGYQTSSDIPSFDFTDDVNGLWFYYYLSRKEIYENLEIIATGTGSKRIHPKELYKIKINTPSLQEQKAIAQILSTADKEIDLLTQELEQLKLQKKGLMQLLLTGIVRVVTDN